MDASDRKNAWINLEDEFWEIEKRWQWLFQKVKSQLETITAEQTEKQEGEEFATALEEHTVQDSGLINPDNCLSLEDKISFLQRSVPNMAFTTAFTHYCHDMYSAVQETTKTMATVKKLMWITWDNDTICESFYDAIQFSQQLLESLSTSWSIAFSLFRARELDLLYRAEKLVHHATNAHQMSLKFILSCWQTYLAAHCHSWTARLNHARTRVKDSGHSVGQLYSRGLVSSHALTVAIAKGLQPLTAYKIMSAQMDLNASINEWEIQENTLFNSNLTFEENYQNERIDVKADLSLMNVSSNKSDVYLKKGQDEEETNEIKETSPSTACSPSENENSESSPLHSPLSEKTRKSIKGSGRKTSKESDPTTSDKNICNGVLFVGSKICEDPKRQGERRTNIKIVTGLKPIRCEANSLYSPRQCAPGTRAGQCDAGNRPVIQSPRSVPKPNRQRGPAEMDEHKHKKQDDSESVCSKCKCCCEGGKRRRLDSGTTTSSASSTSDSSDREYSSQSNCVTVTSNTPPEFKIQEWEALLVDVIDLNKEWKSLSTNLSADSLNFKLSPEKNLNKEKDKPDPPKDVEESQNKYTDDNQDVEDEAFQIILNDLSSSMTKALSLSALEIKNQIKTWMEREKKNELKLHFKGYDPNEAIMQAKSFLFQLMQSFFAMLLLTAADSKRRMLCYASLLPESIAESRKLAYSLILAREISALKKVNEDPEERKKKMQSAQTNASTKPQVVNPHQLCHHLAMALCRAHLLSSKFLTLVSKSENTENVQMEK